MSDVREISLRLLRATMLSLFISTLAACGGGDSGGSDGGNANPESDDVEQPQQDQDDEQ